MVYAAENLHELLWEIVIVSILTVINDHPVLWVVLWALLADRCTARSIEAPMTMPKMTIPNGTVFPRACYSSLIRLSYTMRQLLLRCVFA